MSQGKLASDPCQHLWKSLTLSRRLKPWLSAEDRLCICQPAVRPTSIAKREVPWSSLPPVLASLATTNWLVTSQSTIHCNTQSIMQVIVTECLTGVQHISHMSPAAVTFVIKPGLNNWDAPFCATWLTPIEWAAPMLMCARPVRPLCTAVVHNAVPFFIRTGWILLWLIFFLKRSKAS